ncbi:hypothetical protein [Streptomyces sp. NPDC003719]
MRALPARPIALGALCAALLAGITGPVAMAADTNPGHTRVLSPIAPVPAVQTLLGEVEYLNARGAELDPVADLLTAVAGSDDDRSLPPAEARKLGEAAKGALDKAAARTSATSAATRAPATELLVPTTGADIIGDALEAVKEAVDGLLGTIFSTDGITSTTDTTDTASTTDTTGSVEASAAADTAAATKTSLDHLLAEVSKLVDALTVGDPEVSVLPAPATPSTTSPSSAQAPALPAVTLPALTPPAPVLLPAS